VDARIGELLLEVVQPAGIEAAQLAADQMTADHQRQRQLLVDHLDACREAESHAAREYRATDESYTSVRRKLAAEWEEALETVHAEERRLAEFDSGQSTVPSDEQLAQLYRLGSDLRAVWFDRRTDMVLKKQIVRTLIEEIVVDVDTSTDEIVFLIHWSGGHHTDLRQARRGPRRRLPAKDLRPLIEVLRKVLDDESIASVLNRERIPTLQGNGWTKARVSSFRRQHKICAFNEREKKSEGWLTQAEAATCLGISSMSVSRLVHGGLIPADQPREGLPSVIRAEDLSLPEVQRAVHRVKTAKNGPLPADPNQLSLFVTTDS